MAMTRQERIGTHKKQYRIDSVKQSFKDDTSIVVKPISVLQDSTGGTVSDILNDTTSSVKDDVASLAGKVNDILLALKNVGIVK
tara:strand:- start:259 stop:510 length:252 start_codon:yes stop_codon:yes gene_type:complete